ncbi:ABC-type uncharacterized transport system, periplasmic component [Gammaproteobacteria bacterium]
MKRLLSVPTLIIIFFMATVIMVIYFNFYKPRLLILQSHSRDYSWTRDVDIGIQRILGNKSDYAIRWFYMDTERHTWPEYPETIGRAARRLIEQWQPDVVLAVDDDAQEYVMKYYVDDSRLRIVFAGVSKNLTNYGYDQATNVTGILERKELQAVKEVFLNLGIGQADVSAVSGRTRAESSVKRERPKVVQSEIPRYPGADNKNLFCLWEVPCLKLFPHWQAMVREALEARDESIVVRTLEWSPIRLASYPAENNILKVAEIRQETMNPSVPDLPVITPTNRIEEGSTLMPKMARILNLGDKSEAVRSDEVFIRIFDWHPLRLVESRLVETFPEWQAIVEGAAARADFILTTDYRALTRSATDSTLVSPQEVVQWTVTHSPVPIIGTNGFFVTDGGYLAIAASPFEQGEVAARMLLEIVEQGTFPKAIPITWTRQFILFMRGKGIREKGLRLPRFYESFARATNNYFD